MSKTARDNFLPIWIPVWSLISCATLLADPPKNDDGGQARAVTPTTESIEIPDTSIWRIQEAESAVEGCRAILGAAGFNAGKVDAELVTLKEDKTPYLSEQIVQRPVWQVTVREWSVKVPSLPEGVTDRFVRTLDVYLDPMDGKLLKLETRWPEGEPRLIGPRPDARTAVQQMRSISNERYHGFPSEPPRVSFLEALDSAVDRGGADPTVARQIIGHYVVQSRALRKPRPVWAITLWGIPPYFLHGRAETNEPVFVDRYIVDGVTGKWMAALTTPHPTAPPEKRD